VLGCWFYMLVAHLLLWLYALATFGFSALPARPAPPPPPPTFGFSALSIIEPGVSGGSSSSFGGGDQFDGQSILAPSTNEISSVRLSWLSSL
jgi:hypothetical protein